MCEDDLKLLCQHLPDLEECIQLPDVDAIRNFFLSKSLTLSEVDDENSKPRSSVDDKLAVVMSAAGICKSQTHDVVVTMSYEDSTTQEKKDEITNAVDRVKHEVSNYNRLRFSKRRI